MAQWDQQQHTTTKFYTKVTNMRGCVVLIPPTTGNQLRISVLVTTQNTKEKRYITRTYNNIGSCVSKNEDYVI